MSRPRQLVVVVGTATDVGKSWVTAAVADRLVARGRRVTARKPAQSFEAGDADRSTTDADVLAAATGEPATVVCPGHRWYPVPMAPPMAADALGRAPIALEELVAELAWPDPTADVGFVETAGGTRSPVADDGDSRDLVIRVGPDVVLLVADAGLGTIDEVRLAVDALAPCRPLVFLNRFTDTDLHRRNRDWLADRDGTDVVTSLDALVDRLDPGTL